MDRKNHSYAKEEDELAAEELEAQEKLNAMVNRRSSTGAGGGFGFGTSTRDNHRKTVRVTVVGDPAMPQPQPRLTHVAM